MSNTKLRFTDEEIYRANNINIIDYINNLNLQTKRTGKTIKVEGYGGLYIDPTKNRWNCFSQSRGGGPIQLVMFLENKTWVEAVKKLLGVNSSTDLYTQRTSFKEKEDKGNIILPERNNTYKHMIAYLIQTRRIDKSIVYSMISQQKLYEDKYRNCVFVGYDEKNNPRYASIRGTNPNVVFRGEAENSDKAYSFNISGNTNKLYVFESPIEAMSYLTLQKQFIHGREFNHHILSLGGVTDVALMQYLQANPNIEEINICLNNDKAGIIASDQIKEKYKDDYKVKIEYPINKDFNEDLKKLVKTIGVKVEKLLQQEDEEEEELEI